MALVKGNAGVSDAFNMDDVDATTAPAPAPAPAPEAAAPAPEAAAPAPEAAAPAPAPEAAAQAPEAAAPTQAVATRPTANTAMAVGGNFSQQMAEQGLEGLEIGFGSFPIITLKNNGRFQTHEGVDLGTEFDCTILSTREKFIFKNGLKKEQEDFFYSYDGVTTTTGESVDSKLALWKAGGADPEGFEKKKYLEAVAQVIGQHDGIYLLSIPPSSIPRLSGHTAVMVMRGQNVQQHLTRCFCGNAIKTGGNDFYPWNFMVSPLNR